MTALRSRPKLVVAVSEHDRFGLVLEAAPYATLPLRFTDAVFAQLLAIGVPHDVARRECDVMQPLTITATTHYPNRLSLQANLKDYAWQAEWMMGNGEMLEVINTRLASYIVSINSKLEFPKKFVLKRLGTP